MEFKCTVSKREGKVKEEGKIAGVVSGAKLESVSVELDRAEFIQLFKKAGYSNIVTIEGLDKPVEAMIHRLSVTPLKGEVHHVEFYAIERGVNLHTEVPIKLINEAPAEKAGAVISQVTTSVTITCKPRDLIHEIEVDMATLVNMGDSVSVKDLIVPSTITIDTDSETVIVSASAPRVSKKPEEETEETEGEEAVGESEETEGEKTE